MKKLNYNEILIERKTLDNFDANTKHPIVVILHNIRSNYNVGSLFRTCDSAFVEELILSGYTPHPPKTHSVTALNPSCSSPQPRAPPHPTAQQQAPSQHSGHPSHVTWDARTRLPPHQHLQQQPHAT